MTEAGRRLGALAGTHPATRLNDHSFLIYTPSLEDLALDRAGARVARRAVAEAVRCRRPFDQVARHRGLHGAAARVHRCGRRARSRGTGFAPRAVAGDGHLRVRAAGSRPHERSVRLPARCARRRSLRTDLPADRRGRRRRRSAIPDAAAHAGGRRHVAQRRGNRARRRTGRHDPRHRSLGAGTRARRAAAAPRAEPAGAPVRAAVLAHARARCVCRMARLGHRGARARRPVAGHRHPPGRCVDPRGDAEDRSATSSCRWACSSA